MNRATRCADTAQIKKALSRVDLDYGLYTLLKAAKNRRLSEHPHGYAELFKNGCIERNGFQLTAYGQRLLTIADLLIAHEEAKTAKKLETKLARLLSFNLGGKAIEDIDTRADLAYLAKRRGWSVSCADSTKFVPSMQFADWVRENCFQSAEEQEKAFNALFASPNRPRWIVRLVNELEAFKVKTPDHPTPPAV